MMDLTNGIIEEILTDQIQFYAPDILDVQEGLFHQIEYIKDFKIL